MKSIKNVIIFGGLFACTLFGSCVDAELESVVEYKNHYKTLDDANSAILGLYGKFMGLAEQTIVLGELRADLMDVTDNASIELQETMLILLLREINMRCDELLFRHSEL